ncbi:MAG: insulinase family protein [candidate division WOR-3 bacterium]|nr:insulinase family protein [candidate division WOR-3 bacterium]
MKRRNIVIVSLLSLIPRYALPKLNIVIVSLLSLIPRYALPKLNIVIVSLLLLIPRYALPKLNQPYPEYPIFETYLDNGLRVIIYVDSSTPTVSTQLWFNVGAIYDPPYKSGVSHLLEHMDGTKNYKPREISAIIDALGGEDNAFTSSLYVCYWVDLAKDYYETALKLGAERMKNLVISESKFQSEKAVVMEERRLGENEPYDVLWEEFDALIYKLHPYRNPVIGWMEDIKRIELQDLIQHYRTYYQPSNAVCVIAGAVQPNEALKKVNRYFGKIKSKPVKHPVFHEPAQLGEKRKVIYRKVSVPAILIGFHTCDVSSPDYYALEVLEGLLSSGKSSRLYKKLVYEKQYALRVFAWNDLERDAGTFNFYAMPISPILVDSVENIIYQELMKLKSTDKDSITDEEMARVKNNVIASEVYAKDRSRGMGMRIGRQAITTGNLSDMIEYPKRIEAVTKDDIRRVIDKYFLSKNRTVVTLLPEE